MHLPGNHNGVDNILQSDFLVNGFTLSDFLVNGLTRKWDIISDFVVNGFTHYLRFPGKWAYCELQVWCGSQSGTCHGSN
jgi:hypothetical protein